jgi:glutamate-1-semialdehyde aminotransferase
MPSALVEGIYPTHITHGNDCYLFDSDGKKYIDFICGLGTNLFGYNNRDINGAIGTALTRGIVHSLPTTYELDFAEMIKGKFPYIDQIKILKSGSEGCSAAIKIARAYTGRKKVVAMNYHGWHDPFVSTTEPANGVFKNIGVYKDFVDGDNYQDYAAIILEPVNVDFNAQTATRLQYYRDLCDRHGIVLIFDETITSYRFLEGSVGKFTGVNPDISVMGKAIAGGMPMSVVGGKKALMSCDYFVSSTWSGEILSIFAAMEAGRLLLDEYNPKRLWIMGKKFKDEFNMINQRVIKLKGYNTRGVFVGEDLEKTLFFQEACKAGILFGPSWFYNKHLHEEFDNVLDICCTIIKRIERREVKLEGKLIKSPFSKKVRDND